MHLTGLPIDTARPRAGPASRGDDARAPRRAIGRVLRPRRREGDPQARRRGVHERHGGRRAPARSRRGVAVASAPAGADGGSAAATARHRREPDDRPVGLYGGYVHASDRPAGAVDGRAGSSVAPGGHEAIQAMAADPIGPVHLNCPFEEPLTPFASSGGAIVTRSRSMAAPPGRRARPDEGDGSRARVRGARRGRVRRAGRDTSSGEGHFRADCWVGRSWRSPRRAHATRGRRSRRARR